MNAEGICNEKDFKTGVVGVNRTDYVFPEEPGLHEVEGIVKCRYWGKKKNLIMLLNCNNGDKLKFSFWRDTKYCCEPIPKRPIDDKKESVRHIKDGTRIKLLYENKNGAITRVRNIKVMEVNI